MYQLKLLLCRISLWEILGLVNESTSIFLHSVYCWNIEIFNWLCTELNLITGIFRCYVNVDQFWFYFPSPWNYTWYTIFYFSPFSLSFFPISTWIKVVSDLLFRNAFVSKQHELPINFNGTSAWKVSVFRVILIHIFPHSDWIQTRITNYLIPLNTDHFWSSVLLGEILVFYFESTDC